MTANLQAAACVRRPPCSLTSSTRSAESIWSRSFPMGEPSSARGTSPNTAPGQLVSPRPDQEDANRSDVTASMILTGGDRRGRSRNEAQALAPQATSRPSPRAGSPRRRREPIRGRAPQSSAPLQRHGRRDRKGIDGSRGFARWRAPDRPRIAAPRTRRRRCRRYSGARGRAIRLRPLGRGEGRARRLLEAAPRQRRTRAQ